MQPGGQLVLLGGGSAHLAVGFGRSRSSTALLRLKPVVETLARLCECRSMLGLLHGHAGLAVRRGR